MNVPPTKNINYPLKSIDIYSVYAVILYQCLMSYHIFSRPGYSSV